MRDRIPTPCEEENMFSFFINRSPLPSPGRILHLALIDSAIEHSINRAGYQAHICLWWAAQNASENNVLS